MRAALARREAEILLRTVYLGPSALTAVQRVEALRPRPEDYPAVFRDHAAVAVAHYAPIWAAMTVGDLSPRPGQTELDVHAAEARTLRTPNPLSVHFPGGLCAAADRFAEDQIFVRYRFRAPGETAGYALDGLVPTADGRFVLFPKPWRVFAA